MTFRLRHEFVDGANLLGMQLAHCAHCKTTRVTDPSRHPEPRYLRRLQSETERDTFECPPCVEPLEPKAAKVKRLDRHGCKLTTQDRQRALDVAIRTAPAPAADDARVELDARQEQIAMAWLRGER